jgi:hypothetical protein
MITTKDLKKRAEQQILEDKAYKSTSKHIDAALKSLFKAGFTKDDSLVEALEKAKKYIP